MLNAPASLSITLIVAKKMGFPDGSYTVMKLELASLQSVRDFVANLKAFKSARPLNNLICNAAVYRPTDPEPAWTDDGFEMSMVRTPFSSSHFYFSILSHNLVNMNIGNCHSYDTHRESIT